LGDYQFIGGKTTFKFLGFVQYTGAFKYDPHFSIEFFNVISNTLINSPLIVVFSLIIAVLLSKNFAFKGIYRFLFFLPFVLGTGYVMKYILGMGVANNAMEVSRSIMMPDELTKYLSQSIVGIMEMFFSRITLILWKSGMQILLFLAGLQSISKFLYESAKCDGATEWETFWKITVPMVSPITVLVIIYTIIDSFIDPSIKMLDIFYDYAFVQLRFSYSSALSWIYFSSIMILIGLVMIVSKRVAYTETK
jgi:ABC-type sugar transport system permease subunit